MIRFAFLIIFICSAAWAVEPDEVLTNVEYETNLLYAKETEENTIKA